MTKGNLEIYDTMTRAKRPFKPLRHGKVRMYACGPTVYGDPHIGNFRSFIVTDLVRRWLEYRGLDVTLVMNMTDIDDKTIRDSARVGEPIKDFTQKYTQSFLRGLDLLNIRRAAVYPRATEFIDQMRDFIQVLVDKSLAYIAEDGVYFDIDKFPDYGRLSGVDLAAVQTTERMSKDEYDKEAVQDFALWKKSTVEEAKRSLTEQGIAWDASFTVNGEKIEMRGRPGWHIECSVMTRSLLGDTLDIHAGGEDLVFPHHENEIAQSESLTGKQFVRYWLHIRHLMINGRKMSKSKGNYISFDEVLVKYNPDVFRYFYLGTQYRRPLDYTDDAMKNAENSVKRLENTLELIDQAMKSLDLTLDLGTREKKLLKEADKHLREFENAMNDDFDSHTALDAIHALSGIINDYLIDEVNKGVLLKAKNTYNKMLNSLGLFEKREQGPDKHADNLIGLLVDIRNQYRKEKNYQQADEIRNRLICLGITLADTAEGTTWKIDTKD